ncbi:MAG: aspartate-semialdehyde dehydrogenase [Firmicutes bacterium]|nr:aspartate-semialdehyde dehydrogenase [Bacillota bacterium]
MPKKLKIAVVGATGMVGRKMLEILAERQIPIGELIPYASARSAGSKINYLGKDYTVVELTEKNIIDRKIDYALFSAGGSTSRDFAPVFAKHGVVVIDNSSHWRMDSTVPLIVPEVNSRDIKKHNNIIANPNCSTIQAVVAIAPLHKKFGIKRIVYSTYQAVSGAGVAGHTDLQNGINGLPPQKFSRPIFDNLIPQIDTFLDSGYTKEEQKMIDETRKILNNYKIRITATTVRVPVSNGHSESINVEFNKPATLDEVLACLENAEGIILKADQNDFPTPLEVSGKDGVFVGRVRMDDSVKSGINLWVVADNIRKGAATNAVQILETMTKRGKRNS